MPPGQISVQLWTVRDDLAQNYDSTLAYLAEIGYPKVELALGYFGRTARQLREFLDGLGLHASSSHDGISPDDAALNTKIENALALGQSYIVVPYLQSASLDEWKGWAERMNVEARAAVRPGCGTATTTTPTSSRPTSAAASRPGTCSPASWTRAWSTWRSTSTGRSPAASGAAPRIP
ncbi:sugar phosphate isomerase/epimerase family protein [Nonomuraea antimicrobica]